ncbi:cell wall glucanase, partial [Aureobasidium melanogenum]
MYGGNTKVPQRWVRHGNLSPSSTSNGHGLRYQLTEELFFGSHPFFHTLFECCTDGQTLKMFGARVAHSMTCEFKLTTCLTSLTLLTLIVVQIFRSYSGGAAVFFLVDNINVLVASLSNRHEESTPSPAATQSGCQSRQEHSPSWSFELIDKLLMEANRCGAHMYDIVTHFATLSCPSLPAIALHVCDAPVSKQLTTCNTLRGVLLCNIHERLNVLNTNDSTSRLHQLGKNMSQISRPRSDVQHLSSRSAGEERQVDGRRTAKLFEIFLVVAHTPVLLSVEGGSAVLLPHVVEGGEPDNVGGDGRLHGRDSRLLVLDTGDSNTVGVTLGGPASLGDPGLLAVADAGNLLHAGKEPSARVLGKDGTIEEGVRVDSDKVRVLAKLGTVSDHGNKSVNSNDLARVAGSGKSRSGRVDTVTNLRGGKLAVVDDLVTDGDGGDSGPVTTEVVGDGINTNEHLQVVLLTSGVDSGDLVAVDAVSTNEVVAVAVALSVGHDLGEVAADLVLRLAVTAVGVRGVDDTIALRTAAVGGSR